MPLGFEPSIAQGMAAMGERYGDRLVNQLSQAGSMIENGLKAVTTMKELQSLGQNLSQISPESPDYQQQLMQLGAAHPFAMQDPRGQALINMGNQAHLQWQHQQYAIQAADRAAGRAEAHDNRMYDRAVKLAGMRQKQGDEMVDFNNIGLGKRRLSPTPDFGQDINVPASLNQAPMEMGAAPEAAGVEAVSEQPMKIGLGGRIRNPGLSEGDDGFDYATGLGATKVPEAETPAEDSSEGQEEPNELAVEMRNLAMAQGGSIAKKDLARNAAIASANVRARHAAAAKSKGTTADSSANVEDIADKFGLTSADDGSGYKDKSGNSYHIGIGASGKPYIKPINGDGPAMQEIEGFPGHFQDSRGNVYKFTNGRLAKIGVGKPDAPEISAKVKADRSIAESNLKAANAEYLKVSPKYKGDAAKDLRRAQEAYDRAFVGAETANDSTASYKDYDSLKSGDIFIDPDGKKRRKP